MRSHAIEVFCYSVAKYIGSYVAAMNGVDAIAFTAGIGENTNLVRRKIVAYLGYLGITIDNEVNDATHGDEAVISTPDSKVKVCVIPTNEELAICKRDSCACKIMRDQTGSAAQKMENEWQIRLEKHCQGKKLDNM